MGKSRSNTFKRAIRHLKSTQIDEKLQLINEFPTNNTAGIYVVEPEYQVQDPDVQGLPRAVDFTQDSLANGRDTTGLFLEDGTILTIEPPGDTSYILGPMASMWYAWGNFSTIGYIRQSDRRMVDLGRITGRLGNWNGTSNFTSYGQLTLSQAQWFKDTPKLNGANNDTPNYRAFYPGPPSNTPDQYGRYLCVITGTPKPTGYTPPPRRVPPEMGGFDPNLPPGAANPYLTDKPVPIDTFDPANLIAGLGLGVALARLGISGVAAGHGLAKSLVEKGRGWFMKGYKNQMPDEDTASWGALLRNDWNQRGYTNNQWNNYQKTGQPPKGWDPTKLLDAEYMGTGATPLLRQIVKRSGLLEKHFLQGKVLSESKKRILKDIKKPYVLPEQPKVKYKIKPRANRTINVDLMKKAEVPSSFKRMEDRMWGRHEWKQNERASQERKNEVLDHLGGSDHFWEYMTETSRQKNNGIMYSNFDGKEKKAKIIRKEELKGDTLLFIVDENGKKESILQSELSCRIADEYNKELFEKYFQEQETAQVDKDPLFKKVSKRLKKEIDYPDKPAKKGYPNDPPPEMINGWHPKFGDRSDYYNKLDPQTASAMTDTDDPQINVKVRAARKKTEIGGLTWTGNR